MWPLRIFIIEILSVDERDVTVHKEFDNFQSAVTSLLSRTDNNVLIHIGFELPSKEHYRVVDLNDSRIYLTPSAAYTLEQYVTLDDGHSEEGIHFYTVIEGFGSQWTRLNLPPKANNKYSENNIRPEWLKKLHVEDTPLFDRCISAGIIDDVTYIENEINIAQEDRHKVGTFRYKFLTENRVPRDHIELLKMAPPWFVNKEIEQLDLPVRVYNVLRGLDVRILHDLSGVPSEDLMHTRNFGATSRRKFIISLHEALSQAHDHAPTPKLGQLIDHLEIIKSAPDWFLKMDLMLVEFPARVRNVLYNLSLRIVQDLEKYSAEEFMQMKNFGKKSTIELANSLMRALNNGEIPGGTLDEEGDISFYDEIYEDISSRRKRVSSVLISYLGFNGNPGTLEAVAKENGITRERVRQIKNKELERIGNYSNAVRKFLRIVDEIREDSQEPLSLAKLQATNPFFQDIFSNSGPIKVLAKNNGLSTYSILDFDGIDIITRVNDDEWTKILQDAEDITNSKEILNSSRYEMRVRVMALVPNNCTELREFLWQNIEDSLAFSKSGDYVGKNDSVVSILQAILERADKPLHYKNISRIAKRDYHKTIRPGSVNSRIQNFALLFERGTYGLRKHLLIPKKIENKIKEMVVSHIQQNDPSRQWHSIELYEFIGNEDSDLLESCRNIFELDILLLETSELKSLGRHSWSLLNSVIGPRQQRIEIHDMIVTVLKEAGGPLPSSEIRDQVAKKRGINSKFQVFEKTPIIRIYRGVYGLDGRDNIFTREEQESILSTLETLLETKNTGIYLTEIGTFPGVSKKSIDKIHFQEAVMEVTRHSNRIRLSAGGKYIYLKKWRSKRRTSTKEALKLIIERNEVTLNVASVIEEMELITGLPQSRDKIVSQLEWNGYAKIKGRERLEKKDQGE